MKIELLNSLKNYSKKLFISDIMAGLIVAIIALPLSIAFGIASGVSPNQSLITAIVAGFIVSAFGGTKFQIAGPTGAFVILIYSIVQNYGLSGLTIATFMSGILLIIFGLLKFGNFIKFISLPLVIGFTAGIAILIFTTQISDLLGLTINEKIPSDFIHKWYVYIIHLNTINFYSLFISLLTIAIIFIFPKFINTIPSQFIALVITTLVVKIFNFPVERIIDRFGSIQFSMPKLDFPNLDIQTIKVLFIPSLTIALLGSIESLLSAVVADSMTGSKHDSNTELIAQGIANTVTPLIGGIPATGAIARTATNIKNGGKTPIAGIAHSIFLLLILLFFSSLISYIPMATLGGILVVVAYNMSSWKEIKHLLKAPKADIFVLFLTIILTVIFDLTISIGIGLIVSSFIFMNNMNNSTSLKFTNLKNKNKNGRSIIDKVELPENVLIYEPNGAFFFAVSSKFESEFKEHIESYKYAVIRLKHISVIDASGLIIFENIIKYFQSKNVEVLILQMPKRIAKKVNKFGIIDLIGKDKVFDNIEDVLEYIKK